MFLDFSVLKKGADDISAELKKIRTELESKKREREDLLTLPVPREEFEERLLYWVDKKNAEHTQALANSQPFRGPMNDPMFDMDTQLSVPILTMNGAGAANSVQELALFAILRDVIRDGIKAFVARMDYPKESEVGPHSSHRKPLIDKLDAEIQTLEAKEQDLTASIQKALSPVLHPE